MRISTERLIIREWTLDDAQANLQLYGDAEVMRFLGGDAKVRQSLEEAREALRAYEVLQRSRAESGFGAWAFCLKEDDVPIGTVMLKPLPPGDADIEIGWHLAREHWGKGYATEAARALLDYGFGELGLREIHAVLYSENKRSWAVAERLGMRHLGVTDEYYGLELEHFLLVRDPVRMVSD